MRNPHVGSVIGQEHDGSKRPAGLHREEVASYGKNLDLLQPRDMEPNCMQTTCMATCPSAKQITPPFQDMYYLEKNDDALHSAPTQTKQPLNNASLIGPKLLDTHSDKPQPASHTHSPKHPDSPCHSHHEHTFIYPQDQAQEMADLEQKLSSLSLGRSNDETVSYVQISVHPQTALAWNQVT